MELDNEVYLLYMRIVINLLNASEQNLFKKNFFFRIIIYVSSLEKTGSNQHTCQNNTFFFFIL